MGPCFVYGTYEWVYKDSRLGVHTIGLLSRNFKSITIVKKAYYLVYAHIMAILIKCLNSSPY